jgi:hypothetical protein
MKYQGGRKPALYSVEMGQWVHRNWLANTAPQAEHRNNPVPSVPVFRLDGDDQPVTKPDHF